jgi:hypothetical protein
MSRNDLDYRSATHAKGPPRGSALVVYFAAGSMGISCMMALGWCFANKIFILPVFLVLGGFLLTGAQTVFAFFLGLYYVKHCKRLEPLWEILWLAMLCAAPVGTVIATVVGGSLVTYPS